MIDSKYFQGFYKGAFYMLLSSFIMALFGASVKAGVSCVFIPLLVFLRFFVPMILMIPYYYYHLEDIKNIHFFSSHKHFYRAIAVLASQYTLFHYLTQASLTDGMLLWNTGPMFIPIIGYLCFSQKIPKVVWWSLMVSFIGVACVLKPTSGVFDFFSLYGLLAGFFMGFSQVLYGVNREKSSVAQNVFLYYVYSLFISTIVLVGAFFFYDIVDVFYDSFVKKGFLAPFIAIAGASLTSVFFQITRGIAYEYAKPASLAPLIYSSVIFAALIDIIFGRFEDHGFIFTVGIALVFVGTFIRFSYTTAD